jgi:hypothetical protein
MYSLIECVAIALDRRLAGTAWQLKMKAEFHGAVSCLGVKNTGRAEVHPFDTAFAPAISFASRAAQAMNGIMALSVQFVQQTSGFFQVGSVEISDDFR